MTAYKDEGTYPAMTHRNILAFGHSHLASLQAGYELFKPGWADAPQVHFAQLWGRFDPFFSRDGNDIAYNEALEAELVGLATETSADALVGCLIGSEHLLWAIQAQPRPVDVILPSAPDLPLVPNAEIMPYGLMLQIARETISDVLGFNGRLAELTGLPLYHVLPPPPVASQARTMEHSPDPIKMLMQRDGVPSPIIRYKLWRLWTEVAREVARGSDVIIVSPPAAASDEDGMMRDEYCADGVHANAEYGRLMWQQIEARLGQEDRS